MLRIIHQITPLLNIFMDEFYLIWGKWKKLKICSKKLVFLILLSLPHVVAHVVAQMFFFSTDERKYADLIRDFPLSASAWRQYALFLFPHGRKEEAMKKIDKAISLDPSDPANVVSKIDFLLRNHQNDEAEKLTLEMSKTFKEYVAPFFRLGKLERKKGRCNKDEMNTRTIHLHRH